MKNIAVAYAVKKRGKKMAQGGMMTQDGYQSSCNENCSSPCDVHPQASGFVDEGEMMAEGGMMDDDDMVGRIMKKRQMYSEGGKVANNTHSFEYEFDEPANYDDLSRRDDLEFSYTGKNSGDELGNSQESHDREDMIARIMKSRAKKDKNPRPA